MRSTVRLDRHLLAEADKRAAATGATLSVVLEPALREPLARRGTEAAARPLRLKTFMGNGLRAGVDLDDSAALHDLMDSRGVRLAEVNPPRYAHRDDVLHRAACRERLAAPVNGPESLAVAARRCRRQRQPRRRRLPGRAGHRSGLRVAHHQPPLHRLRGPALASPAAAGDGRAPRHSSTSVARASTGGGTFNPSAAAVRRLTIRSKRVFCCTGSCAAGVPRRIRSTV